MPTRYLINKKDLKIGDIADEDLKNKETKNKAVEKLTGIFSSA